MSDKYTTWEDNIASVLQTELGATYLVTNDESVNCAAGTKVYIVLIQWVTENTRLDDGTTCFDSARQTFRLILTPLSGVTPSKANEQLNIMTDAVQGVLRDYSKVNSSTVGGGYTITEINVESMEKGYFNKRASVRMFLSFLADGS